MARDYNLTVPLTYQNASIPATRASTIPYSAVTAAAAEITLQDETSVVCVTAGTDLWMKETDSNDAAARTAGNRFFPAGSSRYVFLRDRVHKLSFIKDTGANDGFVSVEECE